MGLTPLHMSAGYVRPSTARLLIENGADPELRTQRNERPLDLIRNMRNATKPSSMGGLVTDKRYPLMTEIVELIESVTEDVEEWVVPEPPKMDPKAEEQMKDAMEKVSSPCNRTHNLGSLARLCRPGHLSI
jgi:ankyrin repeat protein